MPVRLTLAPYLAAWDYSSHTLTVNLLVVPQGDPLEPLDRGLPAFVGAHLVVQPKLFPGARALPAIDAASASLHTTTLTPPERQREVVEALARTFLPAGPAPAPSTPAPSAPAPALFKHLPATYRAAFPFVAPRPGAKIGDEFAHVLRCDPPPTLPEDTTGLKIRSWSDVLAFAIRQPELLRRAGMLYRVQLDLSRIPDALSAGALLGFVLAPTSDFAAAAAATAGRRDGLAVSYLTRVPALAPGATRPLFTAVLFPFVSDPVDGLESAMDESERFDDGFAKIVHAVQSLDSDEASGAPKSPYADRGIRLAWDDEDVLVGMNRSLGFSGTHLSAPGTGTPVPRGVVGYRVDVRETTASEAEPNPWHSLCAVTAADLRLDGASLGPFHGELRVEIHPQRVAGDRYWILPYYTTWSGRSLIVHDPVDAYLRQLSKHPTDARAIYHPVLSGVELRYGRRYEFRVRMVDGAGGGPTVDKTPVFPGEAPNASVQFRRFVPLRQVRVTDGAARQYSVARPVLGYPAVAYAAGDSVLPALQRLRDAGSPPRLPDPDAAFVEVRVMVRAPTFDPRGDAGGWYKLYVTRRAFPSDPAGTVEIELQPVDVSKLEASTFDDGSASSGPIRVPTARDIKLELRAIGRDDPTGTYFAANAGRGALVTREVYLAPSTEPEPLAVLDPPAGIRAVFSRAGAAATTPPATVIPVQSHPTSAVVERLATGLGLAANDATLLGPPGRRIVFGCAGAAHRLAPDNSSLTLLTLSELVGSWTCAVRIDLDRDWSWRGAAGSIRVRRAIAFEGSTAPVAPAVELGTVQLIHAVGPNAVAVPPDRSSTSVIFLDIFPHVLDSGRARPIELTYTIDVPLKAASDRHAGAQTATQQRVIRLPVVTPPPDAVRVVAAGHAASPYSADDAYSSTGPRERMLWIELAAPISDPHVALFARVLAKAPDPMLLAGEEAAADPPPYPDLPVPAELARVVVPDELDDHAGLSAMQQLIPASPPDGNSPVHFLVPLPPGVHESSPDLLGFFTYELRFGHDRSVWSTARGRFGPPLVLEGVQHPAPELTCRVVRTTAALIAGASYAVPYYRGVGVQPAPPNTEIWLSLYAQIPQADGSGKRNVQIDVRRGAPASTDLAEVTWDEPSVVSALARLGLPLSVPLSVLAVELLPEPLALYPNPLGSDLGQVRILRTSPLVAVNDRPC